MRGTRTLFILLVFILVVVGCNGGGDGGGEQSVTTQAGTAVNGPSNPVVEDNRIAISQDAHSHITSFEQDMEQDGHIKITKISSENNGIFTTETYKFEFTGSSVAEAEEAIQYAKDYIEMVDQFLNDHPEEAYNLEDRKFLTFKKARIEMLKIDLEIAIMSSESK